MCHGASRIRDRLRILLSEVRNDLGNTAESIAKGVKNALYQFVGRWKVEGGRHHHSPPQPKSAPPFLPSIYPCTVMSEKRVCKTNGVVRRRQDPRRSRRLSLASNRPPPPSPPQSSPSIRRRNACHARLQQPCCCCCCRPLKSQPFPSSLHSAHHDILSELFAPVADQSRFACGEETRL